MISQYVQNQLRKKEKKMWALYSYEGAGDDQLQYFVSKTCRYEDLISEWGISSGTRKEMYTLFSKILMG
jgi:hypothetical protein